MSSWVTLIDNLYAHECSCQPLIAFTQLVFPQDTKLHYWNLANLVTRLLYDAYKKAGELKFLVCPLFPATTVAKLMFCKTFQL